MADQSGWCRVMADDNGKATLFWGPSSRDFLQMKQCLVRLCQKFHGEYCGVSEFFLLCSDTEL